MQLSLATVFSSLALAYAVGNAISAPLNGTTWYVGSTETISWVNATGDTVTLDLVDGESSDVTVVANIGSTDNTGSVAWTIPSFISSGTYALRITGSDSSDDVNYSPWFDIVNNVTTSSSSTSANTSTAEATTSEALNSTSVVITTSSSLSSGSGNASTTGNATEGGASSDSSASATGSSGSASGSSSGSGSGSSSSSAKKTATASATASDSSSGSSSASTNGAVMLGAGIAGIAGAAAFLI